MDPPAAHARGGDPCERDRAAALDFARSLEADEREVARLEAKIQELEASEIAFAQTESCTGDAYSPRANCSRSTFDREAELSRAQEALTRAEEMRDDLEERERRAAIPPECKPHPAD